MYTSATLENRWYIRVPPGFVKAEVVKGVNAILDAFAKHADQALVTIRLAALRPEQTEAAFREEMTKLAESTKSDTAPVMNWLWDRLGSD